MRLKLEIKKQNTLSPGLRENFSDGDKKMPTGDCRVNLNRATQRREAAPAVQGESATALLLQCKRSRSEAGGGWRDRQEAGMGSSGGGSGS